MSAQPTDIRVPGSPRILLHIEGLTVLVGAVALYAHQGGSWLLFALLLLAPDLSMIGYVVNPRVGSVMYNAAHFYTVPALVLGLSLAASVPTGVLIGLIWSAHIGLDRTLGFGLKYPTAFKDSHLQRV